MKIWRAGFAVVLLTMLLPWQQLLANGNPRFERISLEQGLSQGIVYQVLQDHQGFMWFATLNGLNRYDGYHFEV